MKDKTVRPGASSWPLLPQLSAGFGFGCNRKQESESEYFYSYSALSLLLMSFPRAIAQDLSITSVPP
jgi:hypothetical protein